MKTQILTLALFISFTEIASAAGFANKNIVIKGAYSLLMKMKNTEE